MIAPSFADEPVETDGYVDGQRTDHQVFELFTADLHSIGVTVPQNIGLYAAYKQKPFSTLTFPLATMGFDQLCMKKIIEYYDDIDSQ